MSEEPQVQIDQEPAALVQRANEGCQRRVTWQSSGSSALVTGDRPPPPSPLQTDMSTHGEGPAAGDSGAFRSGRRRGRNLPGHRATVDDEFRTGGEAAVVAGEEHHEPSHLIGLAHARDRLKGEHLVAQSDQRRIG